MNPFRASGWLVRTAFAPALYFQSGRDVLLGRAVAGMLWLLVGSAAILFLTGLLFGLDTTSHESGYVLRTGDILAFRIVTPVRRLIFPLYWIGYILFVLGLRYAMLALLDRRSPGGWKRAAEIAVSATVPLVLVGFLLGLFNNLAPAVDPDESSTGLLLGRFVLSMLLVGVGLFGEARVWFVGLRERFASSFGPALVVYLTPWNVLLLGAAALIVAGGFAG